MSALPDSSNHDGSLAVMFTDGLNPQVLWAENPTTVAAETLKNVEDDLALRRRNGYPLSSREVRERYMAPEQMLDTMDAGFSDDEYIKEDRRRAAGLDCRQC